MRIILRIPCLYSFLHFAMRTARLNYYYYYYRCNKVLVRVLKKNTITITTNQVNSVTQVRISHFEYWLLFNFSTPDNNNSSNYEYFNVK